MLNANKCLAKVRCEVLIEEKVRAYCLQQFNKFRAIPLVLFDGMQCLLSNCIHFLATVSTLRVL